MMLNYIEFNIVESEDEAMKRRRNFWGDWEEWQKRQGEPPQPGQPPHPPRPPHAPGRPPMRAEGWRDYFHEFTGEWPEQHWAFGGRRFTPWHQGDVSFNPFVANLFSQGGGLLPLIVLYLLVEKPRYGNELMSLISEKTGGQWAANPGAIYPLMNELENRGMVEGQWEDPRKRTVRLYHLTAKGRRELERVKSIVLPKLDEAIEVLQVLANDLASSKDENKDEHKDEGETTHE
jgi:DNA-binding PadR family transcriptional regulator